jgi:Co/Zn/Cd efflux system component
MKRFLNVSSPQDVSVVIAFSTLAYFVWHWNAMDLVCSFALLISFAFSLSHTHTHKHALHRRNPKADENPNRVQVRIGCQE